MSDENNENESVSMFGDESMGFTSKELESSMLELSPEPNANSIEPPAEPKLTVEPAPVQEEVPPAKEEEQEAAPAKPEEPVEEEPKEYASQWADIKAREREVREGKARLKAQSYKLSQEQERLKTVDHKNYINVEELRDNPIKALAKFNMRFDELGVRALEVDGLEYGDKQATRNDPIYDRKFKDLEEQNKQLSNQMQQMTHQNQINKFNTEVDQVLSNDEFNLLRTVPDANKQIGDLAVRHNEDTGEMLTFREYAVIVQDTYREQLQELRSVEAVRQVLGIPSEANTQKPAPPKEPASPPEPSAAKPPVWTPNEEDDVNLNDYEELEKATQLVSPETWAHLVNNT